MERMTIERLERKVTEKEKNYKIVDGDYICKTCDSEILGVSVIFSIHNGSFPMSGSGQTSCQNFPYCPTCEEKPEISGVPITMK